MDREQYTVGRLAGIAGVTVRALHHDDEIGLLPPSGRSAGGYRLYTDEDVSRLRRILFARELGLPLDAVARMLDGRVDAAAQLRRRREDLVRRADRIAGMLAAIDRELEARSMDIRLTPDEQRELFGSDRLGGDWADEAEERWGDGEQWAESRRRTAEYGIDDWRRIRDEERANVDAFAALLDAGTPADSARATEAALEHRAHISRCFSECTPEIHRGLAAMYLADPRFRARYDTVRPGLADYIAQAILAA